MDAAQGILTATGGMTSHAAVVARGMGKPCVSGVNAIHVDDKSRTMKVGKLVVKEGDWITIDGSAGTVMLGAVPTIDAEISGEFQQFMAIADKFRRLKVRSNSDIPRDAIKAREFGGEGIGLCRTEHMFFAEDRLPHVVRMIMAAPQVKERRVELEARTGCARVARRVAADRGQGERGRAPEVGRQATRSPVVALKQEDRGTPEGTGAADEAVPRSAREAAAVSAQGLLRAVQSDVRLPGHDPNARSAAARVPAQARGAHGGPRTLPAGHGRSQEGDGQALPDDRRAAQGRHAGAAAPRGEPARVQPHARAPWLPARHHLPEITEMQARAIFEAACEIKAKGGTVVPES
jgi:phosphoenolpyruvate synthase/pyruvate phosphate dikinase